MYQEFFKDNYYIKFRITGQDKERYWQIQEREAFQFETGSHSEFASLAAGATSSDIFIEFLEPNENELYHIIPGIQDGMDYYLRLTLGHDTWGVARDTDIGFINHRRTPYFLPNAQYGFFVALKTRFSVRVVNNSGTAGTPKVWFEGQKYRIVEVTDNSLIEELNRTGRYTKIQLGGFTR